MFFHAITSKSKTSFESNQIGFVLGPVLLKTVLALLKEGG